MKITIEIDAKRIQGIASNALHSQMDQATAEAFLLVHGPRMEEVVLQAIRNFTVKSLEAK